MLASVNRKLAGKLKLSYYASMEHTELARLGGLARAKKLTKKRRKEIAVNAGKAGGRGRKRVAKKGKGV